VFGLGLGEILVILIVAIIVVGPRNLPKMMRTLGRTIARLRRVANDLREQSGIDEILKAEGIEKEVGELRKIASGRILDINLDIDEEDEPPPAPPPRDKEYPPTGIDCYRALEDNDPYVVPAEEAPLAHGDLEDDDPQTANQPESAKFLTDKPNEISSNNSPTISNLWRKNLKTIKRCPSGNIWMNCGSA
jgi:sec-independent protein translocase protein TatB